MNYLELCQTTRQECGAAGNGPASVVSQLGESLRFVNWVRRAWLKIQTSRNAWKWMRAVAQPALTADVVTQDVTSLVPSRFGRWCKSNFSVYLTAEGITNATEITEMDYDAFVRAYVFNAVASGRPVAYAIAPNNDILLGPAPTAGFSGYFPYFKSAQELTANADVPELPLDNHWIIVYEAMKYYGRREAAAEVMADAREQYEIEEYRLERDQLEQIVFYPETLA